MAEKNNVLPFPSRVVIELTPGCNLSCPMCPRHHMHLDNGFMEERLWNKLIDEISSTAPDTIILPFWRGESLLHPRFQDFMRYAFERSLKIHLSTNGLLAQGETAAVLAECEFVTFSVHTESGYLHAREFLRLKKGGRPVVQISFVKGERTSEKLLGELLKRTDLGYFDSVRLYEEHSRDGVFGKSSCPPGGPRVFCPKLMDTLVIAFDGSVSRCNHMWKTEEGPDVNVSSIQDVWGSGRLEEIRRGYPDADCEPCDQWTGHTCGESWRIADGQMEHKVFTPEGARRG